MLLALYQRQRCKSANEVSLLGYLRRLPQHHPVLVADEVAALAVGHRPARLQRTGPEE
jgi:hypothetical protein